MFFFFNDAATTEIYTLSLHDALPILGVHRPASRGRIGLHVSVGVQLGEKLLHGGHAGGEHEGLVPVISRAKIPLPKSFRHSDLRQFFALPKDAKLGFSTHHFSPAYQAYLAAAVGEAIICQNLLLAEREFRHRNLHGLKTSAVRTIYLKLVRRSRLRPALPSHWRRLSWHRSASPCRRDNPQPGFLRQKFALRGSGWH